MIAMKTTLVLRNLPPPATHAPPLQKPLDTKTRIVCFGSYRKYGPGIYTPPPVGPGVEEPEVDSLCFSRLGRPLRPPHRGAVAGGAVPTWKNHRKIDFLRPPSGPPRLVVVYISRAPGPVGAAPFPGQGAERHLRGGSTMPESRAGSESGRLGNNAEHQRKTSTKPSNPQKLRDLARERFLYQRPYCKHRFSCPCCRTDQPPRERHAMTRCVNHNCTRTIATKA